MYGNVADGFLPDYTYEIKSQLGSGGCGAVYLAWHKRLRKYMVLKELRDSSSKTTEACRNEVEALKNIKNMYIPHVYDFFTQQGNAYTVMEYIEGISLDKQLASGEVFDEAQLIKWYYQLAAALEALHRSDICHRDIKPANIIQMPDGDVCLIDYNSAYVKGNNTRIVNRSAGYASPEQHAYYQLCEDAYRESMVCDGADRKYPTLKRAAEHSGSIDWKLSDIYSLGATMYHLYTGKRPGTEITPESPGQIMSIIKHSMNVKPKERFLSAGELRRALQGILAAGF